MTVDTGSVLLTIVASCAVAGAIAFAWTQRGVSRMLNRPRFD